MFTTSSPCQIEFQRSGRNIGTHVNVGSGFLGWHLRLQLRSVTGALGILSLGLPNAGPLTQLHGHVIIAIHHPA